MIEDLAAVYEVGLQVANGDTWPNWYKDNAFRAARDKMLQGKAPAAPKAAEAAAQ